MRKLMAVVCLLLCACTVRISGEMSMLKKLDRPAESYTVRQEDTSENVKVPIKAEATPEPIPPEVPVIAPVPKAAPPVTVPKVQHQNYEVPPVIIPEKATPIQYLYIHEHKEDGHACYVRKTLGVFATLP